MSPSSILAPGRVNLLGEHVDYNGGPVLPVAIDRAVRLQVDPLPGRLVQIRARDLDQEVAFNLDELGQKIDATGRELPGWSRYPAGVAWAFLKHGLVPQGMRADFTSDIPIGAGLSSSAAVEMAFAVAWRSLGGWEIDNLTLARLAQEAENLYVGVNCGLMDQFACAMGVKGHALYFDTQTLAWETVAMPAGSAIVIADSGLRRGLRHSAYNQRRQECDQAFAILSQALPGIRSLRDVTPDEFIDYAHLLPEPVRQRARFIVEECARVDRAVEYLKAGDALDFGELMYETHAGLRDLFAVSTPELDTLVEIASGLPGVWGARLTGAGFGGCTVNLIQEVYAASFIANLQEAYHTISGLTAQVYLCHASQGAHQE